VALSPQASPIEELLGNGFYLLISPSGPVEVGHVWEGTARGINTSAIDRLETFVKPKNIQPTPVYRFPAVVKNYGEKNYRGAINKLSRTNIAVDFFKGLFARIAKVLNFSISGSYSSQKTEVILYDFVGNASDSVMINPITRSLENFIRDSKLWQKEKRYFVVTQVYKSKNIGMAFLKGDDKKITAEIEAAKLANVNIDYNRRKGEAHLIFSSLPEGIPFGVRLGELTYDFAKETFTVVSYDGTEGEYVSGGIGAGADYEISGRGSSALPSGYRIRGKSKRSLVVKKSKKKTLIVNSAKIGPKNNIAVRLLPNTSRGTKGKARRKSTSKRK
jgi:hypothetical protein